MRIINPFRIDIEPIDGLLIAAIEKDPDRLYKAFEPQYFKGGPKGRGHLVIAWRNDGFVDIYHQKGLSPAREGYRIAGRGPANMVECDMDEAHFSVSDCGVEVRYRFTDIEGRMIEITIEEADGSPRKPFGLLAPMGDAAEDPPALPLVFIDDFYFVRRRRSQLAVSVDGRRHRTDNLPFPIDGRKMTFARYGTDVTAARINTAFDGAIDPIEVSSGVNSTDGGNEVTIKVHQGQPSIEAITGRESGRTVTLTFDPPFPSVLSLNPGDDFEGEFSIKSYQSTGEVAGRYYIERAEEMVTLQVVPSQGWRPRPDRLGLKILYRLARVFRRWPATYMWNAYLDINGKAPAMRSRWIRVKDGA